MHRIEIYTKNTCGYCMRAKALLDHFSLPYIEYEVSFDMEKRQEMEQRSNQYTVPQIFINDESIGGSDELVRMYHNGGLEILASKLEHPLNVEKQEEIKNVA